MDPVGHHVSIIESALELEAIRELWQNEPCHPLADYEFFLTIAKVRASTSQPLVLVLYRDERAVSLLAGRIDYERRPIRLGYATLGTRSVRQVRFIAGGFLGETTSDAAAIFANEVGRFLRRRSLGVAVFEQLGADCVLQQALSARFGSIGQARTEGEARHWKLQLPTRWSDFMAARSSKHRYWLNRLARVLDADYPANWHIEVFSAPGSTDRFLAAADAVASKSYHRTLGVGFRRDEEFSERVLLDAARGRLRGYVLLIEEQPCAFWYCIVYRGTLHLIATAYDPGFQGYELGTVLLMRVFRDHCGSEATCVDFGLGDAVYKRRFGSTFALEGPTYVFAQSVRGLGLRCLYGCLQAVRACARAVLERAQLTQRLKTLWRRRLARHATGRSPSP